MRDSVKGRKIDIKLTGVACSGKTTIMHIIGKALREAGFNVFATDGGHEHDSSGFDPRPIYQPDERPVHITTSFPND